MNEDLQLLYACFTTTGGAHQRAALLPRGVGGPDPADRGGGAEAGMEVFALNTGQILVKYWSKYAPDLADQILTK